MIAFPSGEGGMPQGMTEEGFGISAETSPAPLRGTLPKGEGITGLK